MAKFKRPGLNSREDILRILRESEENNIISNDMLEMIEGAFQVSKIQVKNIMIPRSQMIVVRESDSLQEMLPTIIASAHSRFPVIGDSRDEILGILLAKDLLRYFTQDNQTEFNLQDVVRSAVVVPESKRLNSLLNEFKNGRNHMAIVVERIQWSFRPGNH